MRKPKADGPIADGEATVFQRAQAWNIVEAATTELNNAMNRVNGDWGGALTAARTLYFAAKPAEHADKWRDVQAVQNRVITAARAETSAEIVGLVKALDAALAEYVRIGGSEKREPGVGGLA